MKARIIGLGSYLPEKVLSNSDLEKMVETSDEWIRTRTGMSERRIARDDEAASDMGAAAALKAVDKAMIDVKGIDLIIVTTMTPDYISPSTAAIIQERIGATNAAAFDLQAACSGFLYGLSVAKAYVESGIYRHVMVVATEKNSAFIDYQDRNTCVLFGDGAVAAIVSDKGAGFRIDGITLGADGAYSDLVMIPGGGSKIPASDTSLEKGLHYIKMNGKEVYKQAVRRMTSVARECLGKAGIGEEQISWIVPHQANARIIESLAKNFNIPDSRIGMTLHKYGNTSAAGIGITLDELTSKHSFKEGEHLLLLVVGGGLTWGATVLTQVTQSTEVEKYLIDPADAKEEVS